MGAPVDRFLPMKVPLGARYDSHITPEQRFSVDAALAAAAERVRGLAFDVAAPDEEGQVRRMTLPAHLGLVIDLTRSSRYYDTKRWLEAGVKYVKVGLSAGGPGEVACWGAACRGAGQPQRGLGSRGGEERFGSDR